MSDDETAMIIPLGIEQKWQETVNIAAQIIDVPAALIMITTPPYIQVHTTSHSPENVYIAGDKELLPGLYCETVINSQKMLLVPNALKDKNWDQNPDIKLGMISYLGFPLNWPDQKPFGTICVLDSKENSYSKKYEDFILSFKKLIETDLELIDKNHQLNKLIKENNKVNKELKRHQDTLEQQVHERTSELFNANNVLRDEIIQRERIGKKLRNYMMDLQRSNNDLEEFTNFTSHDLKEPLRKIITFGERVSSSLAIKNDKERHYLSCIIFSAG
jgi:hypothetical protein